MEQTKITAKIYSSLLNQFDKDIRERFLKRDAFLNKILHHETAHLKGDLEGKRLSALAHKYIAGELKRMGTTQINIVVDKVTSDRLNAVVKECNMVRDAFLNYLLLCLRSTDIFLKFYDLPRDTSSSGFEAIMPTMPVSPLNAIGEVMRDPFCYLREAVAERHETGLYALSLPKKYHGFSCYLTDAEVPGSAANREMLDELMSVELEQRDEEAFGVADGRKK